MSRPTPPRTAAEADERDTQAIANFLRAVLRDDRKPHATAKGGVLKRRPRVKGPSGKGKPKAR